MGAPNMILYKIRNWNSIYENNRTRELKKLDWFPMPNKQDGDGYTLIMAEKDGAAIFGAWVACAQIASRCDPRGTLLRDGSKPHDSVSLSRMSRVSEPVIKKMLDICSSPEVNWLESSELGEEETNPASEREIPASECLEGKGREGKEEKVEKLEVLKSKHPTLEEVKACVLEASLPESDAVWFWNKCESNGWTNGGQKIKSWRHTIAAWKAAGYMPSQKIVSAHKRDTSGSPGGRY